MWNERFLTHQLGAFRAARGGRRAGLLVLILQMRKQRLRDLGGDLPEVRRWWWGRRIPLTVTLSPWPSLHYTLSQSEMGCGAESEAVKTGEDQKGLGAEMRTLVVLWSETRDGRSRPQGNSHGQ